MTLVFETKFHGPKFRSSSRTSVLKTGTSTVKSENLTNNLQ